MTISQQAISTMRSGRKRKSGLIIVREPNGRPSRTHYSAKQCSPAEVRRLRDAALSDMQAPEWGMQIGRLFLAGKLTADRFEAGKRWATMAAEYHEAIGAKPFPGAIAIEKRGHSHPVDPDSNAGQKQATSEIAAVLEMQLAHAVLIGAGCLAEYSVRSVCERDEAPVGIEGLDALDRGLMWLSQHWGLTPSPKNVRNSKSN